MENLTREEMKRIVTEALEEWVGPSRARMAYKWHGGKLIIQPEDTSKSSKELDIEVFFHKIVMLRESLRVLEQKLNNHPNLDDEDRVQLQQYISRIYGTLTTFNVLFANEEDRFVGQKSK